MFQGAQPHPEHGGPVVTLGLTALNFERLKSGFPIIAVFEHGTGGPTVQVQILYRETQTELQEYWSTLPEDPCCTHHEATHIHPGGTSETYLERN